MGSVGGLTRTYGLQDHFTREHGNSGPPRLDRDQFRRVLSYIKPYLRSWIVILACIGAAAGLGVLPPIAVRQIIDKAIPQGNTHLLALLCGALVALAVVSGLVGVLQQTLTAKVGQRIMYDLRNELYRHLQTLSLRFYTVTRSGEIVSRINNDVNAVQGVATGTIVQIASNFAMLTATSIALFSMDWKLALLAVTVVPLFYLPSRVVGGVRRKLSMQTQESQAALLAFLNERLHISGSILTNIFGQRGRDADEFATRSAAVRDLNVRQAVVGRWLFMILSVFSSVGPAIVYWYGGYKVIQEQITLGTLVAFAALLTLLYRPMVQLATVYVDIQAAMAVFDRIFEYLDLRPDVQDKPNAAHLRDIRGHVVLQDVCFAYPRPAGREENGDAEPPRLALSGVNFEIKPGQRVALVGPSGAGKTTVTYLVPRFYDPDGGIITLDGHDLRDLDQQSLRAQIGMVTQETFLFHSSIRENLLYARPDATEAQLIDACRAANIHDFIADLPDRYETIVGERGFRLSGGEKQRLSIARALLKNPRILILDEATSNLDATSERLIQDALEKLLAGRTSLIIAHRLSTILSADQIVVLQAGQVVEKGTHAQLLTHAGLYSRLFHQQFAGVLGGL